MEFTAYKITCTVSGKAYIGITTKTLQKRWNSHQSCARLGDATCLCRAIRKYGVKSFEIKEVAKTENWDSLLVCERDLILEHGTFVPNGYNMTVGGEGALGHKPSVATKRKISESSKHRAPISQETRSKMADASRRSWASGARSKTAYVTRKLPLVTRRLPLWTGRKHTPETRKKMASMYKTPEAKAARSKYMTGHYVSDAARAKMSASHSTPEAKAAISARNTGRVFSSESRKKMSARRKQYCDRMRATQQAEAVL